MINDKKLTKNCQLSITFDNFVSIFSQFKPCFLVVLGSGDLGQHWTRYYRRWPRATLQARWAHCSSPGNTSTSNHSCPLKDSEKESKAQLTLSLHSPLLLQPISKHMFALLILHLLLCLLWRNYIIVYVIIAAFPNLKNVWEFDALNFKPPHPTTHASPYGKKAFSATWLIPYAINHTTRKCGSKAAFRLQWRSEGTGQSRVSAQDKVIWGDGWYCGRDGEREKKRETIVASSWSSPRSSFLSKGSRMSKKLDLKRTSLAESVVVLAIVSFFHLWLKFFIGEVLVVV